MNPKGGIRKKACTIAEQMDKHVLYEESVQGPDFDLTLASRFYRRHFKTIPRVLREDFCGTATLSAHWIRRNPRNRAIGIDLHKPTLDWGRKHHIAPMTRRQRSRIELVQGNVLSTRTSPADIVLCLNFSCFIFKTRPALLAYFKKAHSALAKDGVFVMDVFGGKQAMSHAIDVRQVPASVRDDHQRVPAFTYEWEQARFNVITHEITCHIHFRFRDGSAIVKAFSYDWRLWTLPELRELLQEAGFSNSEVYLHGWTRTGEGDERYARRVYYENESAWLGYLVAVKR